MPAYFIVRCFKSPKEHYHAAFISSMQNYSRFLVNTLIKAAAMFLGEMLCFPAYFIVRCFKRPKSQQQDNVERDDKVTELNKEEGQGGYDSSPGS